MEERIQKIISAAGITSRRAAEELIAEGRVRVNGTVVTELGTKADPNKDHIKVDGKLINPKQPPTYIMLNKPAGFMTTMADPEGRPTVHDLLKGVKVRVYPVGRLDYNTEGLLLLTNDGDFAHLITHPKHEFPKTYLVKLKGVLDDGAIAALEAGVFLKDGKTAPARIRKIRKEEANSWVDITIHEGRKRQVRRMFDHMGHSVIRLKRVKTGGLTLGDLAEGAYRHLTSPEVALLRETAEKTDDSGQKVRVYKPENKRVKPEPMQQQDQQDQGSRVQGSGESEETLSAGPKTMVMRETADGRRKNQLIRTDAGARTASNRPVAGAFMRKPDAGNPDWKTSPRSRPAAGARPSRPGTRSVSGRPRTGSYLRNASPRTSTGRPATGPSAWKAGSRPDTRPGHSRSSAPARGGWDDGRSSRPSSFGSRPARPSHPGARAASDRPATGSYTRSAAPGMGSGRPSTGSFAGKAGARPRPNPGAWPSKGGVGGRVSGPRPNKSTHIGGRGPARGPKGGGRGAGRR